MSCQERGTINFLMNMDYIVFLFNTTKEVRFVLGEPRDLVEGVTKVEYIRTFFVFGFSVGNVN